MSGGIILSSESQKLNFETLEMFYQNIGTVVFNSSLEKKNLGFWKCVGEYFTIIVFFPQSYLMRLEM